LYNNSVQNVITHLVTFEVFRVYKRTCA